MMLLIFVGALPGAWLHNSIVFLNAPAEVLAPTLNERVAVKDPETGEDVFLPAPSSVFAGQRPPLLMQGMPADRHRTTYRLQASVDGRIPASRLRRVKWPSSAPMDDKTVHYTPSGAPPPLGAGD